MVWEFHVAPEKRRAFERTYGPQGVWARFFATGTGYVRTELIRDLDSTSRYFTLDYWQSRRHYEMFRKKNRTAYLAIDEECDALTVKESKIGWFTIKP